MKILENGKDRKWNIEGKNCDSTLEYQRADVQQKEVTMDGLSLVEYNTFATKRRSCREKRLVTCDYITCPVCGKTVVIAKHWFSGKALPPEYGDGKKYEDLRLLGT